MKKIIYFCLTVLLFVFFLVTLVHIPPVKRYLIRYVSEQLEAKTGWHIEVEDVAFSPPFSLKATNVLLTDQKTPIHVESLIVSFRSLYMVGITLDAIQLSDARLLVFYDNKFALSVSQEIGLRGTYNIKNGDITLANLNGIAGPFLFSGDLYLNSNMQLDGSKLHIENENIQADCTLSGIIHSPNISVNASSELFDISATLLAKVVGNTIRGNINLSGVYDQEPFSLSSPITLDAHGIHINASFELEEIKGKVSGRIDYTFEQGSRLFADINEVSFQNTKTGVTFNNISATVESDFQQIIIKELSGSDDEDGHFVGKGFIDLNRNNHFPFEIDFELNKTHILQLEDTKLDVTGDLKIIGNANGAEVYGSLSADSLRISLSEKSASPVDTIDVIYINQTEPLLQTDPSSDWPLKLEIELDIPGTARITDSDLSTKWEGHVNVKGSPESPKLFGELKVIEGKYLFNGRTFDIDQGTITFAGDIEKKTSLYVIANMDIEKNNIEVIVKGHADNPEISFRSNPSMSQQEILSWLLFNKGLSNITTFQGSQLNHSITNIKKGNSGPNFLNKLKSTLGLDRIDISGNPNGDEGEMKVKVGKYISKSTFLSVSKKITNDSNRTTGANAIGIESELTRDIKLQAEVDDDSSGQINLLWKRNY